MKIIILEDLKGFTKITEVPVYEVAELPPIKVELFNHSKTYPDPTSKKLSFYPKGEIETVGGVHILKYKQM